MAVMNMRADEQHAPMTVDDLERLPEDGRRYELVDGRLDVSPAPVARHSCVEARLQTYLGNIAPDGIAVFPGAGINFNANRTHHRIPDLSVIRDEDYEEPYFTRPPLLAIEVVSPSSMMRDFNTKVREYAKFGVHAYWIIQPSDPFILELRLEDGEYREVQQVVGDELFKTDFPFEIQIVPRWLVEQGPWRSRIGGDA